MLHPALCTRREAAPKLSNQLLRTILGVGRTWRRISTYLRSQNCDNVMSRLCHISALPCVVSFKGETSVGQAIPLRGMFTAILQVTKLVWRQNNVEEPRSSVSVLHICLHSWLPDKRKVTANECNSNPQWRINSCSPRAQMTLLITVSKIQQSKPYEMIVSRG